MSGRGRRFMNQLYSGCPVVPDGASQFTTWQPLDHFFNSGYITTVTRHLLFFTSILSEGVSSDVAYGLIYAVSFV